MGSWPRSRSSRTSRRRSRPSATPSSPSSTSKVEPLAVECLVECQMECHMENLPLGPAVQDPQLKKWTKLELLNIRILNSIHIFIYTKMIYCAFVKYRFIPIGKK